MKKKINSFFNKHRDAFLIVSTIIFELILYATYPYYEKDYIILVPCCMLYVIAIYLILNNRKTWKKNIFYIIYAVGVILRTVYIFKTSIYIRQHDVLGILDNGHLAYIYNLFATHHLPLTNEWQFYHPPLWHFIGATWLHINSFFNGSIKYALEGIQIFSLLFSSFIMIVVDRICEKIKLSDNNRNLVNILFAVHPFLILMSGHINNDILLIFLQMLIILLLFNYHENKSIKNIIYLALATGFCVMTKMNGALMAVPILFVFIKELIDIIKNNKSKIKLFFVKMFIFGFISLPIGLWYQIRNLILFSSNKVPPPGDWLYTGDHSIVSRFLTINFNELTNFAKMDYDYNVPAFLIKSSLFGEYSYENVGVLALNMVFINTLLIVMSIVFIFLYLKRKKYNTFMNVLFITWIINVVSIIIYNFEYPYACSMDFRFIGFCLLPGILFLGYMAPKIKHRFIVWLMEYSICLFAIMSIIFVFLIK